MLFAQLYTNVAALYGGGGGIQPTSALTDNFNDNSMNATLWGIGQLADPTATTAGVTVAETSGQLQITGPWNGATHYSGYLSNAQYKLQGDQIVVKAPNASSIQNGELVFICFGADASNAYRVQISNGSVLLYKRVAGTNTSLGSGTIGTAVWFRLRESGGTLFMDTAPSTASNPPITTDWTTAATGAVDAGVSVTSGFVSLCGGSYSSGSTPTVMQFDGLNTAT